MAVEPRYCQRARKNKRVARHPGTARRTGVDCFVGFCLNDEGPIRAAGVDPDVLFRLSVKEAVVAVRVEFVARVDVDLDFAFFES